MTAPVHCTVTVPAAPRQERVSAAGAGLDVAAVGEVGSGPAGLLDGAPSGPELGVAGMVVADAVRVVGPAVGEEDFDGCPTWVLCGCVDRVGLPGNGLLGGVLLLLGSGAVDSVRTSRPAASITRHVTAATTITVRIHTSTPTSAARPFT
jgi:hypothetical protein